MNRILLAPLVLIIALIAAGCGIEQGTITDRDFIPSHMEDYDDRVYDGQDCGYSYGMNPASGDYENYYHCEDRYRTVTRQRRVPDKWTVTIKACKADDANDCDSRTVDVSEHVYDEARKGYEYNVKTHELTKR
jgi:hypothetical protein